LHDRFCGVQFYSIHNIICFTIHLWITVQYIFIMFRT
jgi:hypothetical protein